VTEGDQHTWNEVFGNFHNIQQAMGPKNISIEMVVYGDAIPMLRWDSPVANRVQDAISDGVKVVACENSMDAQKLTHDDMQPNLDYVRAGIVELIKLQTAGWAYIRP
jgi:intracellular sulfur oxidation DsrE/DsrF family protein